MATSGESSVRRLLATLAAVPLLLVTLRAADVSGVWSLAFQLTANQQSYRGECTFKHEGERITGSCISGFESLVSVRGSVKGRAVSFEFATGADQAATLTFSGELDQAEEAISGSFRYVDPNGGAGDGTFTASRP